MAKLHNPSLRKWYKNGSKSCIDKFENLLRSWTRNTPGLESLSYRERLKRFQLTSTERRSERYIIIFCFKVIEKLVNNPGMEWKDTTKGRKFIVPSIPKNRSSLSVLEKSFFVQGPQLWNQLPLYIRNTSNITALSFKGVLDLYLSSIPDEPYCSKNVPTPTDISTGQRSNSMKAWIPFLKKNPTYVTQYFSTEYSCHPLPGDSSI